MNHGSAASIFLLFFVSLVGEEGEKRETVCIAMSWAFFKACWMRFSHNERAHASSLLPLSVAVPSCLSLEWVDSSVGLGFPADRLVGAYGQNFCQGDNLNTVRKAKKISRGG